MRSLIFAALVLLLAHPVQASDQLAEARRLYNLGQYDAAEKVAAAALESPAADAARVVIGRVRLERYRQSADPADLTAAREALRAVDPLALDARAQVEYTVGLGEALYLQDLFGAAAQIFESVLTRSSVLGTHAHERVLDWWATALDRHAQTRPVDERAPVYDRILSRMTEQLEQFPGSTAASYWLTAAARGRGDLERAWHSALAGWVRASLAEDRGAELRADLDRLVVQAILPERAARLGKPSDARQAFSVMLSEWEAFKTAWSR
jgi:hypothetical protein